jgi:hypothetical protein
VPRRPGTLPALAACAWLLGCSVDPGAPLRTTRGDGELYAAHVQPYVEARCASLDCHGAGGRPLRLYSELGLRSGAALRRAPIAEHSEPAALTARELSDNEDAFAAIALASTGAEPHLALTKPLAVSAGGIAHEGGVHWPTRDDPGYRCLHGYLTESDGGEDVADACARALAATRDR